MEWKEAKERTLTEWLKISDSLGQADSVSLVTEINAVSALCDKAREVAESATERCSHCIAFGDTKICEDYRFRLSELVLQEDLGSARELLAEIIARIRDADLSDPSHPG